MCALLSSWFKFDDDLVTEVTETEAVRDNYGGAPALANPSSPAGAAQQQQGSAYMLTYVRVADAPALLRAVAADEVPRAIADGIAEENALREAELVRSRENTHMHSHTGQSPQILGFSSTSFLSASFLSLLAILHYSAF